MVDADVPTSPQGDQEKSARRWFGESAAAVVEYALLVALITLVAMLAVQFLGDETSTAYHDSARSVDAATN